MAAGLIIPKGSLIPGLSETALAFDSNVTSAQFDLVNIQSGQVEIADAGERIAGYNNQKTAVTSASSDVEVVMVPFLVVIMDNDNDGTTFAATHVGDAFDITGGTGAQIVDTSTTTGLEATANSAQLACLEYNPQGVGYDDDTSVGKFMVREFQFSQV